MFKPFKRIVLTSPKNRNSPAFGLGLGHWLTFLTAIPLIIIGTLAFSIVFVLALIPIAIMGFRAWRLLRKLNQAQAGQSLEADYTVISVSTDHRQDGD